uniref:Amino acid transporter transmembrane domain-containing protein n=1 Tax=Clastoptera arizonana TaxID=38151 RepID=A0A1B6E7B3_9HEMI
MDHKVKEAEETNLRLLVPTSTIPIQIVSDNQPKKDDGHGIYEVKHPTTYMETLLHMVKGNVGSGVFAMGNAFSNAGLILGPILTIFLGVVCVYGNHILVSHL